MEPLTFLPSYAQDRLWLLNQLNPDDPTYNLAWAFRLTGPLDVVALRQALSTVVGRHEVLRTTFRVVGDRPMQVVAPSREVDLPVERDAVLSRRLAEEARKVFDLERGPLLKSRLFRLADEEHVLLLRMHHIVSDAWSIAVLLREIASAYSGAVLPELPFQYADFAAWQRTSIDESNGQLGYWRDQLAAAPAPPPRLPADHSSTEDAPRAGSYELELPSDLVAAMRALARAEGATLFMGLLCVLTVLLGRYTRQDDVVVGTPIAGRDRPELEDLIGVFINTLALRIRTTGNPTFRRLLGQAREVCLLGFENAELPFQRIVEELRPSREHAGTPFFRVLLAMHNAPLPVLSLPGLTVRREPVPALPVPFDLVVSLIDHGDKMTGRLDYAAEKFDEARIARLAGHFRTLLASAVAAPDEPIAKLAMLTDTERRQAVGKWTEPQPVDRCLHELVAEQAARRPGAVAVTDGSTQLTYAELDQRARRLADELRGLGIGPDVLVGACVDRGADLVVALLAVLTAGGAYLPLDPAYPDDRLATLVENANPRVLLTQPELAARLPTSGRTVTRLDAGFAAISAHGRQSEGQPCPDNLAYVIHTSGSTGTPNGVLVTHANVVRLLRSTQPWFSFGPADVWSLLHSFAFDFSVWELWGALVHGGRIVIVPRETAYSPDALLELLRREGVTILNQTPSAFAQLDPADEVAGTPDLALRLVILGGEALDPRTLRHWFDRRSHERPRLVNMYGITETTVHVTYRPMTAADVAAGTSLIGAAIPDLRALVLDDAMNLVPVGNPGELYVGGPGLARGYLARPALTAQRFRPDPFASRPGERLYRTGDLVRRRDDGSLEFLGRVDDQTKIRGFRIEPGEVRAALLAHADVDAAAVVALEDEPGDLRLVGYVVPQLDPAELRAFLARRLPGHMVPGVIVPLDRLPLTANGKLDRTALPRPGGARPTLPSSYERARTPVEEALTAIWAEVFGLDQVGVHDDFLELGGHSQIAVRLRNRIRDRLGFELPVRAVFENPTIAEISRLLAP